MEGVHLEAGRAPLHDSVDSKCARGPIRAMSSASYNKLCKAYPHYTGRRSYHMRALKVVTRLIKQYQLTTALELGPLWKSLIENADVMDCRDWVNLDPGARLYHGDASQLPWPFEQKYDLILALQVFEHLDADLATGLRMPDARGVQRLVFEEMRRKCRHAIISLPIDWTMSDGADCHHQISEVDARRWFESFPPTDRIVGNNGPRKRIIYVFENCAVT